MTTGTITIPTPEAISSNTRMPIAAFLLVSVMVNTSFYTAIVSTLPTASPIPVVIISIP